jgi:hypothetical protein
MSVGVTNAPRGSVVVPASAGVAAWPGPAPGVAAAPPDVPTSTLVSATTLTCVTAPKGLVGAGRGKGGRSPSPTKARTRRPAVAGAASNTPPTAVESKEAEEALKEAIDRGLSHRQVRACCVCYSEC